jgi:hypothetical protein
MMAMSAPFGLGPRTPKWEGWQRRYTLSGALMLFPTFQQSRIEPYVQKNAQ